MDNKFNIFENGKIRVMREQCKTCIFRPGNLMHLQPGRLASMIKGCIQDQTTIPCHSTLYDQPEQAVCRGLFDRYADRILPLNLGKAMGIIEDYDLSEKAHEQEPH